MSIEDNFFTKRRSVMAKKMTSDLINAEDLSSILQAGIRVPDHGALSPWRLKVIQGDILKKLDEEIILTEFIKKNPDSEKSAQVVLSSGAVCMNLLSSAQSMGYAAQWLTEWYSYNEKMLTSLGGRVGIDKIAGFIYIGHKKEEPLERKRPDPKNIIKYL